VTHLRPLRPARPRIVVAGAGVAGLEAVLALRATAGESISIELIAPEPSFTYRAMAVAEPFGYARPVDVPITRVTVAHDVGHVRDRVVVVDGRRRLVRLASGREAGYDALILATGAVARPWMDGALTFGGPDAVDAMRDLLGRLESGEQSAVVFTSPPGGFWTLPLYELALMTAAWCGERHVNGVRLAVATHEADPLEMVGPSAGRAVRELLADRGIGLRCGAQPERRVDGHVRLSTGETLIADAVVTLPVLEGAAPEGVPTDRSGFIAVGDFADVPGLPGVFAAGDGAAFGIKQGGLAAQQADVAVAAALHGLGLGGEPRPFDPVVRGLLLTGVAAAYLRGDAEGRDVVSFDALWWPPTKVAGRHLGPFLADLHEIGAIPELAERPLPVDAERAAADRREMRRLAVEMAEADARWGDLRSALRWLQTVEWLDGALPQGLATRRAQWRAELGQPSGVR
jgi:sulfide:quinone oxidoreductase